MDILAGSRTHCLFHSFGFVLALTLTLIFGARASSADLSTATASASSTNVGQADLTVELQKLLDAACAAGGGIVSLPAGKYPIKGHLTIPENVTLEGIWRAPVNGNPFDSGSV